jgi:NifU-like protein involved in Fe-S cluster formation
MPQRVTNVYLENTVVQDIRFETRGKVFLRGSSEVRGEVINGDVIRA